MLHGHYWTLRNRLTRSLQPAPVGPARAWFCDVSDPKVGRVRLAGRFNPQPGSDELLVVVHGLGGSSRSPYTLGAASTASALGINCLRLDLRGADLRGDDFYHAGLASDLDAVLDSPHFRQIRHAYLLGYSLGGHICLRYAAGPMHPKVAAVATICSPLDLSTTARAFDRARFSVYRWHVLSSLKAMYYPYCDRHPQHAPASPEEAQKIREIRQWDERIVAPRYGFASAQHYYESQSAARSIEAIAAPCLLLHTVSDPMVPIDTIRPWTRSLPANVTVIESPHGGHIGFSSDFRLGQDAPPGLEPQVVQWLRAEGERHTLPAS